MGAPDGSFCMPIEPAGGACPKGYAVPDTRNDIEGSARDFCLIAENRTTCEAFLAVGTACSGGMATECAADGAVCGTVDGVPNLCTLPCAVTPQCPQNYTCSNLVCDFE
jgi:hypothetical protein